MGEALRLFGGFRALIRRWVRFGVLLGFATGVCGAGLLGLSGWFIVMCTVPTLGYLVPSAAVRALAVGRIAAGYGEKVGTHAATLDLLARIRTRFFRGAANGDRTFSSGDLLARITADVDALDLVLPRLVVPAASGILVTLAGLGTLTWLSLAGTLTPAVAVLAGLAVSAVGLLCLLAYRAGNRCGRQLVEARASARSRVVETVEGLPEITSYRAGDLAASSLDAGTDRVEDATRRIERLDAHLLAAGRLVAGGAQLVVLTIAVSSGAPTAMAVVASVLSMALVEILQPLPIAVRGIGEAGRAASRLTGIIDSTEERPTLRATTATDVPTSASTALPFPIGGITLVSGRSGSGKSTLLRALARQYGPDAVLVAQDDHLFDDTVAGNLRLAEPDADDTELRAVLAAVDLTALVDSLPAGLDTPVGAHGRTLSGGQRRRLALARALLRRPTVLLLDEPTEGLDERTAERVLAGIRGLLPEATMVLAAHDRSPLPLTPDRRITLPDPGPSRPGPVDGHSRTSSEPSDRDQALQPG